MFIDKKINYKQFIKRIALSIVIILIFFLLGYLVLRHFNITSISKEQLQEKIESYGSLGPFIFILISFLQVTFIPLPSTLTILVGSYLFTPFISFFYSFIGIMAGSLFAFFLGRKLGKPFVNWLIGDKEIVEYYINKLKNKDAIILFIMLLLPFFPDDTLCLIAGVLSISFSTFFVITFFCRVICIAFTIFFMSGEIIPYRGWGLCVIILVIILGIITFIAALKHADKINEIFTRTKRKKK